MNNLFRFLLEVNITFLILYLAYKIFFEKDKNFVTRRIYLLGVIVIPFILLLVPETARVSVNRITPVTVNLEGITIFGSSSSRDDSGNISLSEIILILYFLILSLGILKLLIQLTGIFLAVLRSEHLVKNGITVLGSPVLHASSFFGYIFINPEFINDSSADHILEHERIHKREWHSIDRILVELFVISNWFNPVAWILRKSVIGNLEYMADSVVVNRGTDPEKYQLSLLNQYIGSASMTNQFNSQIKKRITMLNKNYKLGSSWKIALLIPLAAIAFFFVSCTEKE